MKMSAALYLAECVDCNWRSDEDGAIQLGAQHHDATGHWVMVDQVITTEFGSREGEMPLLREDVGGLR